MKKQYEKWFEEDMALDISTEKRLVIKQFIVSLIILGFIFLRQLFDEEITFWIQSIIY